MLFLKDNDIGYTGLTISLSPGTSFKSCQMSEDLPWKKPLASSNADLCALEFAYMLAE